MTFDPDAFIKENNTASTDGFDPDDFIQQYDETKQEPEKGDKADAIRLATIGASTAASLVPLVGDTIISPLIVGGGEFMASLDDGKSVKESFIRAAKEGGVDALAGLLLPGVVSATKKMGSAGLKKVAKTAAGEASLKGLKGVFNSASEMLFGRSFDDLAELATLQRKTGKTLLTEKGATKEYREARMGFISGNSKLMKEEKAVEAGKKKLLKRKRKLTSESLGVRRKEIFPIDNAINDVSDSIDMKRLLNDPQSKKETRRLIAERKDLVKKRTKAVNAVNRKEKSLRGVEAKLDVIKTTRKNIKERGKDIKKAYTEDVKDLVRMNPSGTPTKKKVLDDEIPGAIPLPQIKKGPEALVNRLVFASLSPGSMVLDFAIASTLANDKFQRVVLSRLSQKIAAKGTKGTARLLRKAGTVHINEILDTLSPKEIQSVVEEAHKSYYGTGSNERGK